MTPLNIASAADAYTYRVAGPSDWMQLVDICAERGLDLPVMPPLGQAIVAVDSAESVCGGVFLAPVLHIDWGITRQGLVGRAPSMEMLYRTAEDAVRASLPDNEGVEQQYLATFNLGNPAAMSVVERLGLEKFHGGELFEGKIRPHQ